MNEVLAQDGCGSGIVSAKQGEAQSDQQSQSVFGDSISSLQVKLDMQMRENADLKFSLQLNKESLAAMLESSNAAAEKERNLIETINIISKDNGSLKEQVADLESRLTKAIPHSVEAESQTAMLPTSTSEA